MKNKLFTIIRIIISFSLIGLLLWLMRDSWPEIITAIKHANVGFLLAGFFTYLIATWVIAYRLQKVISVQGIMLNLKESLYLTYIGYFFNNFLPTSFGGDVVKAYYAGKKSGKKAAAYAGVFMDRVLAMLPFTLIPAFALAFCRHKIDSAALKTGVYFIFFSCLVLVYLLLNKNTAKYLAFILEPFKEKLWYKKVQNGYGFLNLYGRHKLILGWSFFLSVIAQAVSIISTYFFARAVGIDYIGMGIYFIVVPIVWIMTLIPSLNGLGVREGTMVYLLKGYMPAEKAFAISILVLASLFVFSIIGGILYSLKKNPFTLKTEVIK